MEESIVATAKDLATTVPAARDDPFYGLDRLGEPDLRLLQRLTRHGDFRKYVFVLDVGAGLGGPGRWLALRYGCRVLGLEACPHRARVAQRLSTRAGLRNRVMALAGGVQAIPAADGAFTQIWSVEALHGVRERTAAIAELFRVLRPGSPLAMQEIVRRDDSVPPIGGAWHHGTAGEYLDALRRAGFRNVVCEDVTGERDERSPVVLSAQDKLLRRLDASLPPDAPWRAAQRTLAAVAATVASADYRVLQLFARRPSV